MVDAKGKKLKVGSIVYSNQVPQIDVLTCINMSKSTAEFERTYEGLDNFKLTAKEFKNSLWRIR